MDSSWMTSAPVIAGATALVLLLLGLVLLRLKQGKREHLNTSANKLAI